jgi:L-asparagine transporter-like permease
VGTIIRRGTPKADDKIMLDASAARKIRHACEEAQRKSVPYAEIFLALASLFIGGTLSALISQVAYELKFQSVLFYTICPVAGVGFAVAYWFYRKKENIDIFQLAEKVEEYIINPDEAESEE